MEKDSVNEIQIPVNAPTEDYIAQPEASAILEAKGFFADRTRISQLCRAGRFPGAVKVGHIWIIPRASVENFQPQKPGRQPKKPKPKTEEPFSERLRRGFEPPPPPPPREGEQPKLTVTFPRDVAGRVYEIAGENLAAFWVIESVRRVLEESSEPESAQQHDKKRKKTGEG